MGNGRFCLYTCESEKNLNIFSYGVGDWKNYGIFGQSVDNRNYKMNGFLGFRLGQGEGKVPRFIDIGPAIGNAINKKVYFLHINLLNTTSRRIHLHREKIIHVEGSLPRY